MNAHTAVVCLACGGPQCRPLGPGFEAPLSTAGWPETQHQAEEMHRFPLAMAMCAWCGHVQNNRFDPKAVRRDSGLHMYNSGERWSAFLDAQSKRLIRALNPNSTVLEIGHGGGEFLSRFAEAQGNHRCVGVDPSGDEHPAFHTIRRCFEPSDIRTQRPNLLLIRHVLEHLAQPRQFAADLCHAALELEHAITVYVEVPSIEIAVQDGRFSDFLYEHASHFTVDSMRALWGNLPAEVEAIETALDGEVIWARIRLHRRHDMADRIASIEAYPHRVNAALASVRREILQWVHQGERVVVWGGTGKAAAFMNRVGAMHGVCVVDSDWRKVGGWVPGVGTPIEHSSVLVDGTPPIIVVPSRWRVSDVLAEIDATSIAHNGVFTEGDGALKRVAG